MNETTTYSSDVEAKYIKTIRELVEKYSKCYTSKFNNELREFIKNQTPLLNSSEYKWSTRIYWILNGITEFPKCANPECSNTLEHQNAKALTGYANCFCSVRCAHRCKEIKEKIKATTIKHFGGVGLASKELREKQQRTMLERHGDVNYRNWEKHYVTMIENHGVKHFSQCEEGKERIRQTNIERYGTPYVMQNESIKQKSKESFAKRSAEQKQQSVKQMKQTKLERYGDPNYQNEEKKKQTLMKHYGVEHPCESPEILERAHQTNLKNNGVDWPMQSKRIREKSKEACRTKYGVDYSFQSENNKIKSKQTRMKRYGVENIMQSEAFQQHFKEICLERFGTNSPLENPEIYKKARETMLERYGVEFSAQNHELRNKQKHKYRNEQYNITFDSYPEYLVYHTCQLNDIECEYSPKLSFDYEFLGKHHSYFPDFLINGKLFEVKGDYFFRINETTGQEEMYYPYRDPKWSNEKYFEMCSLVKAKHQCMIQNHIILIKSSDISKWFKDGTLANKLMELSNGNNIS